MKKIGIGIAIIGLVLFSGCSNNSKLSTLPSGTYDADTFRAKYDPKPGVDYTEVLAKAKARKANALHLPSGTYDADTFRAKYDPDPNVDYGYGKGSSISSSSSSSWATFGAFLGSILITSSNTDASLNNSDLLSGYDDDYGMGMSMGLKPQRRVRNGNSAYEGYKRNTQRSNRANASNGYQSLSGGNPQYNLDDPTDRHNYSSDLMAQHNDQMSLKRQMNASAGQNFGGY